MSGWVLAKIVRLFFRIGSLRGLVTPSGANFVAKIGRKQNQLLGQIVDNFGKFLIFGHFQEFLTF